MKRRVVNTLGVVVLLSLTGFAVPLQKDAPARLFVAEFNLQALGPNQVLRLSCVNKDGTPATVAFRWIEYDQGDPGSGVYTHTVTSNTTTNPVMLMPGEGASVQVQDFTSPFVLAKVLSSSREVRVLGIVFDTSTQRINAILDPTIARE
jgi:hypothetical protein